MKTHSIALAGNPNSGKTTLFNLLTGSRQRVGNWPGVTVERMEGFYLEPEARVNVTDLPGIYSLSAFSPDEAVALNHLLTDKPDLAVNILDASNLERNLYLTSQLLELRIPMVVVLNMTDIAGKRNIRIEAGHLARHLGCPVVSMTASRGAGLAELRAAILAALARPEPSPTRVEYDSVLEAAIEALTPGVAPMARMHGVEARWLALKLLDQDALATGWTAGDPALAALAREEMLRVERHTGESGDIVIADGRYGFIHGLARDVTRVEGEIRKTVSDSMDAVALNRFLGIPVLLGVMYAVFMLTIRAGRPFVSLINTLCETLLVNGARAALASLNSPEWLIVALAEGAGRGIQTVASFIPTIFLLFFCISILEDSGYMARGAFVTDRFLRTVGLPGKAFLPLLVGFGCNVPGILAARTLENPKDRLLTVLVNPFMSCGARLPVYTLFAAAFFPRHGDLLVFGLYLTGIGLAVGTAWLFKRTFLRGEASVFVMELPPYHVPTFSGILFHTWARLKSFLWRAGKIIVPAVIGLSFLNALGPDGRFTTPGSGRSILNAAGRAATPLFAPLGIGERNWPATVGIFTGVFAKEAVVGTLDALYGQAAEVRSPGRDTTAGPVLARFFDGRAGAVAYLLFILLYCPCLPTLAAIGSETGRKWAVFAAFYFTTVAWLLSTLFYQTATFLRHPASSSAWIAGCLGSGIAVFLVLKHKAGSVVAPAGDLNVDTQFPS